MKKLLISTLSASLLFTGAALADDMHNHQHMKDMPPAKKMGAQAATYQTVGVVQKTDPANGTVTITHEAIPALKWPAMTMPFTVSDKAMLGKFKAGEKVACEFKLEGGKGVIVGVK